MDASIRPIIKEDIPALKGVLDSTELFPSAMLDDMIHDFLTNSTTSDIWFTALEQGVPVSIGYCAPERMTEGTFNLYAIAVHNDFQGKGIGRQMMSYIEEFLRARGGRILLVETSGKPEFNLTRSFYHQCMYIRQAVIPEFYDVGDDKVVFWKNLRT